MQIIQLFLLIFPNNFYWAAHTLNPGAVLCLPVFLCSGRMPSCSWRDTATIAAPWTGWCCPPACPSASPGLLCGDGQSPYRHVYQPSGQQQALLGPVGPAGPVRPLGKQGRHAVGLGEVGEWNYLMQLTYALGHESIMLCYGIQSRGGRQAIQSIGVLNFTPALLFSKRLRIDED